MYNVFKGNSVVECLPLFTPYYVSNCNKKMTLNLFDRLNRGGTQLNHQEMRNALYQGASTKLINELSRDENFKKATKLKENAIKTMNY